MELQRTVFQYYFLWSSDMKVEGISSETSLSKGSRKLQFFFALARRSTRILPCAKCLTMDCNQTHRTCDWYEMIWPEMGYIYLHAICWLLYIWFSSLSEVDFDHLNHLILPCLQPNLTKAQVVPVHMLCSHQAEKNGHLCHETSRNRTPKLAVQCNPTPTPTKSSSQPHSPKMKSYLCEITWDIK